jgi:hypothetical protein
MPVGLMLLAAIAAGPTAAQLGCDRLLEQGLHAWIGNATRKDFAPAAYAQICATLEKASRDATGAAAKDTYVLLGGEGEYDRAKLDGLRTAYCALAGDVAANRARYEKAAHTLNPSALKAWRRCADAAAGRYGPPIEIEQIDAYTMSFGFPSLPYDLRSVRVRIQGFDRCAGFVRGAGEKGRPTLLEAAVLAKGQDPEVGCFRRAASDAPCGDEVAAAASLDVEFEAAKGQRVEHRFELGRVMSRRCAPPPAP